MTTEKVWKVVAIVSEYRLIINAGMSDIGVGDRVEVFERGPEITDPDTGLSLGHVSHIKARLKIIQVEPQIAVAESDEYSTRPPLMPPSGSTGQAQPGVPTQPQGPPQPLLELLRGLSQETTVRKPLRIRPEDAIGPLRKRSPSPINIGDLVRLVPQPREGR